MKDLAVGLKTDIHEIFASYQGEGIRVGEPMIFVRFARCDLSCRYCDTPPPAEPTRMDLDMIQAEVKRLDDVSGPHQFVCLTGGEPLKYASFLKELLPALQKSGFKTYLESDGTKPKELAEVVQWVDQIAMDIKLPSSTGLKPFWDVHEEYLEAAGATELFVKVIVSGSTPTDEVARAARLTSRFGNSIPFVIQPATVFGTFRDVPIPDQLDGLVQTAMEHLSDVRVIGQNHKLIGVR